jgi:uncharacterized protein YukE
LCGSIVYPYVLGTSRRTTSSSVVHNVPPIVSKSTPAVNQYNSTVSQSDSAVNQSTSTVSQFNPAVSQSNSTVNQSTSAVSQSDSTVSNSTPTVDQSNSAVSNFAPTVSQFNPAVSQSNSTVNQFNPAVNNFTLTVSQSNSAVNQSGSDRQSMLTKERRSLSLSKRPSVASNGAFDRRLVYFDKLSNRLSNHRHRVDHFHQSNSTVSSYTLTVSKLTLSGGDSASNSYKEKP